MVKLKAMESELNHAHESIEEEQEGKTELQKQLTATKNDAAQLRARLDNEATPRIEELEDTKYASGKKCPLPHPISFQSIPLSSSPFLLLPSVCFYLPIL